MWDQLNSVTHSTLEKKVYSEILQAIVSGKLSPGSSVTITELAEGLNVSLMPVRTALKALEAKNLIQPFLVVDLICSGPPPQGW